MCYKVKVGIRVSVRFYLGFGAFVCGNVDSEI